MSDTDFGGGTSGGDGSSGDWDDDDDDGGGSGAWWHLWSDIKRWATGGQKFEVSTERAVVGVRG